MTGLNLETFLNVLRADLWVWTSLAIVVFGVALLVWTSWGARRALRKCLVLSVVLHLGAVLYGSTVPLMWRIIQPWDRVTERPHIRQIRVVPRTEAKVDLGPSSDSAKGKGPSRRVAPWDRPRTALALADALPRPPRPDAVKSESNLASRAPVLPELVAPTTVPEQVASAVGLADRPEPTTAPPQRESGSPGSPSEAAEVDLREIPEVAARPAEPPAPAAATTAPRPDPSADDLRRRARPDSIAKRSNATGAPQPFGPPDLARSPIPLARVTPPSIARPSDLPAVGPGTRPLREVPEVYRPRLDPNRSALAQRGGASEASEQAVERALDWLARHQDADGRWDGATARRENGTPLPGDDDFTVHCPPGETCFGESLYWEADTALTGLALLAYLGAGYTHADGKYAATIKQGLEFLLKQQKSNGDLRGPSRAVGMYCHAMATLALCESFALTGDERLRGPVERALGFLRRSRARDGLAWRYTPGDPVGDTSILGWVVLALKSGTVVGIPMPVAIQTGVRTWLDHVASGPESGLARYQPQEKVTPTMTAEAWVCRQFLGFGGPGRASSEAAEFLLQNSSDRGSSNYYYWYYGTLALYQHGGAAWSRWNDRIRDQVVSRQRVEGHQAGSWDPDDSPYGSAGGRLVSTTLAALTLEVYYRYLRLYDDPGLPPVSEEKRGT